MSFMHCSTFNQNHKLQCTMRTKPANYCGQSPFKPTSLPYNSWNFNFKHQIRIETQKV